MARNWAGDHKQAQQRQCLALTTSQDQSGMPEPVMPNNFWFWHATVAAACATHDLAAREGWTLWLHLVLHMIWQRMKAAADHTFLATSVLPECMPRLSTFSSSSPSKRMNGDMSPMADASW